MIVELLRDDGGIVYLNGVEIFRSNMPPGPVDYLTFAVYAVANAEESAFFPTNLDDDDFNPDKLWGKPKK